MWPGKYQVADDYYSYDQGKLKNMSFRYQNFICVSLFFLS